MEPVGDNCKNVFYNYSPRTFLVTLLVCNIKTVFCSEQSLCYHCLIMHKNLLPYYKWHYIALYLHDKFYDLMYIVGGFENMYMQLIGMVQLLFPAREKV